MTVEAMKAGAVEFLTKPFTDEVLLGVIRQAMREVAKHWAVKQSCRRCATTFASLSQREQEVMAL